MSPRGQVYLFAALFILAGVGLTAYKAAVLHFPLLPDTERKVWNIEAKITFEGTGDAVIADLALPQAQETYEILDEVFGSSGYGFSVENSGNQRRAIWTRREVTGPQILYYKLQLTQRLDSYGDSLPLPPPQTGKKPLWSAAEDAAARALIQQARQLSADPRSFTLQLLQLLNDRDSYQDADMLFQANRGLSRAQMALKLLAEADIPARMVRGVRLRHRHYNQPPAEMLEVFDGRRWQAFDPQTATAGLPEDFFMWQRGGQSLLDLIGGKNSHVRFSVLGNDIPAKTVALKQARSEAVALVDFNIYSLPVDKQNIFKFLLLVPIGALIVALFRVLVGVRTSGTFMPVLIALAFIQTSLSTGILILITLVTAGLWIRSYLSRLDLLMVTRLAAVIIVVVILMAGFSVFSYKLGLDQMLTITFFPMIIIAWTIERMSITWEEDGAREVFVQGSGSLLVSIVAYLCMTNTLIEHLTYNFPEILLVELGLILLLGQYTGYRLSELHRFRFLVDHR